MGGKRGLFLALLIVFSSFALADLMAFQGKALYQGVLVYSGNITVTIYDAPTGGSLIYDETFNNVIQSGFFDVMLGNSTPLNLIYGENYWIDLAINGNDIDWQGAERKKFESGIGSLNVSTGWQRTGTNVVLYDSSDKVGIGTIAPWSILTLFGSNHVFGWSDGTVNASIYVGSLSGGGNGASIGTIGEHGFRIFTNNTDRIDVDEQGKVTIPGMLNTSGGLIIETCEAGSCPNDTGTPAVGQIWLVI